MNDSVKYKANALINEKRKFYREQQQITYEEWVFNIGIDIEKMFFVSAVGYYKTFWYWIEKHCLEFITASKHETFKLDPLMFCELPKYLKNKLIKPYKKFAYENS